METDAFTTVYHHYMSFVMYVQVRFPRSKKKRIQKKWRKQGRNWEERAWH